MRWIVLIFACLLAIPVLADPTPAPRAIAVGYIGSLSNYAAEYGRAVLDGIELAQEELRAQGIKAKLFVEDDGSEPRSTLSAYRKLTGLNKVEALITGTWWANSLVSVAAKTKMPLLSCETMYDKEALTAPNYFIMEGDLKEWVRVFEPVIAAEEIKSGAILRFQSGFGETLAQAMTETFSKPGRSFLGDFEYTDIQAGDTTQTLLKIRSLKPQVLYIDAQPAGLATILKRIGELGMTSQRIFTHSIVREIVTKHLAPAELLVHTSFTSRQSFGGPFAENFRRKFGRDPSHQADLGYYSLLLIAHGLEAKDALAAIQAGELPQLKLTFGEKNVLTAQRHQIFDVHDGIIVPHS